jgi:hypothetical protein
LCSEVVSYCAYPGKDKARMVANAIFRYGTVRHGNPHVAAENRFLKRTEVSCTVSRVG